MPVTEVIATIEIISLCQVSRGIPVGLFRHRYQRTEFRIHANLEDEGTAWSSILHYSYGRNGSTGMPADDGDFLGLKLEYVLLLMQRLLIFV